MNDSSSRMELAAGLLTAVIALITLRPHKAGVNPQMSTAVRSPTRGPEGRQAYQQAHKRASLDTINLYAEVHMFVTNDLQAFNIQPLIRNINK
jgi:hypothetical protein